MVFISITEFSILRSIRCINNVHFNNLFFAVFHSGYMVLLDSWQMVVIYLLEIKELFAARLDFHLSWHNLSFFYLCNNAYIQIAFVWTKSPVSANLMKYISHWYLRWLADKWMNALSSRPWIIISTAEVSTLYGYTCKTFTTFIKVDIS